MNGPDFGVLIVRLSILAAGVIMAVTPGPRLQKIVAAILFAWLAAEALVPLARRWLRRRRRGRQAALGDALMAEAGRAMDAATRDHLRREAATAYDAAREQRNWTERNE